MVRGRPKRSADVKCTCRTCGKQWTVPEWKTDGRAFCSRPCFYASVRGVHRSPKVPREERACELCGATFLVGGRGNARLEARFCSISCASRRHPPPRKMSKVEAAWFAGIFDGEGTIIRPRKNSQNVRIAVGNTCYPLLERILGVTGTGSLSVPITPKKAGHAVAWTWHCYGDNAKQVLAQIRPWLIVKASRADEALL